MTNTENRLKTALAELKAADREHNEARKAAWSTADDILEKAIREAIGKRLRRDNEDRWRDSRFMGV